MTAMDGVVAWKSRNVARAGDKTFILIIVVFYAYTTTMANKAEEMT